MTARTLTLYHQTRLVVHVVIEDDSGVLAFSILLVTGLFRFFQKASRFITVARSELSMWFRDIKTAVDFTGKVLAIGFNALAYGLGITL